MEADVRERFAAAGVADGQVSCVRDTYVFDYEGTPQAFLAAFRDFYGPTMNAFAAAAATGKLAELQGELEALFAAQNTSKDAGRTVIPATFLRVTVQV